MSPLRFGSSLRSLLTVLISLMTGCGGAVEQMISAPAVQFKGSGWYVTDYAKKSQSSHSSDGGKDSKESKDSKDSKDSKKDEKKSDSSKESTSKKAEKSK